jgi:hypothetical protein
MRWIRALGYIIAIVGAILASAKTIVDWLGRLDFIISHRAELGWIGGAVEYLTAPPWWLPWGVLVSGLAIIWADSRHRIKTAVNPKVESDVNLTMESNLADLPNRCPEDGQIASMRLFYRPDSGVAEPIGFIIKHCQPGVSVEWFADLKFPQIYRCEITNYGPEPLLQVGLKFKIEYQEISPSGESGKTIRSGNTIHSGEWPVLLPKIDPGRSNSVVFYVYNQSRYFARVAPPEVASYINLNDGKRQQASLLHIGMVAGMSFWPVEQTTPPSAIPVPATNPWKHVLEELYACDFTDLMSLQRTLNITISDPGRGLQNTTIDIRFRLYQDFRSNTDFASLFIPVSHNVLIDNQIFDLIKHLRDEVLRHRDDLRKNIGTGIQEGGIPYDDSKDMKFSGRVFIYTMQPFTIIQLGELTSWYQSVGMSLQVRGMGYWEANKDR